MSYVCPSPLHSESDENDLELCIKNSQEAIWTEKDVRLFIDILLEYKRNGEMRNNNFGKAWNRISKDFNAKADYSQTQDQLSQKFNRFRADWNAFKDLRERTGLGWDLVQKTVTATNEQWKDLIKINKAFKKFRDEGLEFNTEFTELFLNTGAVGESANAPGMRAPGRSQVSESFETNPNTSEPSRDDDGERTNSKRAIDESSVREEGSKGKNMVKGPAKEDIYLEAATEAARAKAHKYNVQAAQCKMSDEYSIEKCMEVLYGLENEINSDALFIKASDTFVELSRRVIFLKMSRRHQLAWVMTL